MFKKKGTYDIRVAYIILTSKTYNVRFVQKKEAPEQGANMKIFQNKKPGYAVRLT